MPPLQGSIPFDTVTQGDASLCPGLLSFGLSGLFFTQTLNRSSTRNWRTFLFICLVFFSVLPATAQLRKTAKDYNKWEPAIKAFEASDKTNAPPRDAILFVGSSSIRLWKNLTNDFAEFPVINRGFGGSQIADSVRYVQRIVVPHRPKVVVFYAGDNDLSEGKDPEQLVNDFKRFVYKVHWARPKTKIIFVSIKPSPARWKFKDKVVESNRLIKEYCDEKGIGFLDVYTPMLNDEGKPREELFAPDRLHLNKKGYELWTSLIKPKLAGL